jgi:hypothetical protein
LARSSGRRRTQRNRAAHPMPRRRSITKKGAPIRLGSSQ